MKQIRKVYFQNPSGDRWGLNGDRGVFASNLTGLGFSLSPNFTNLGRGFFSPVSDESEPQQSLPFTLTFTKAPYDTYKQLVDWLSAANPVTIVYNPTGRQEYCRDVVISFFEKNELNAVGWLEIPCSYLSLTPWYLPTPTTIRLDSSGSDESKRYVYEYTDALRYGADSSAALSVAIPGAGHIPGALSLSVSGALANPRIRLAGDISGKTYGVCSVATVTAEADMLQFSSRYEDSYVRRMKASGEEVDLLDVLDLSSNPFFHIPVNEPCTLTIEADAPFVGQADLLIFYYYRSV